MEVHILKVMKRAHGFTIVELLIVIVVIGILAAISIVAYNGVSNSAHDAAVKADLSKIAKGFEMYKTENASGMYPGIALGTGVTSPDFRLAVTKDAYLVGASNAYNLLNCRISGGTGYAMIAQSKSSKYFMVSSSSASVAEVTAPVTLSDTSACTVIAPGSSAYGAGYSTNTGWRAWTNG